MNWLKNAVFYEIYPQSFQDGNGDGIGDFRGIIRRLDYIKELGCNAIWMNPCYDSPFADAGYDVRNYYQAAERYGTNEELRELFEEVHKRGMHILLDLVPGHTSIDCEWFVQSMKAERNEYTDRYIWTDNTWEDPSQEANISGSLRGICDRDGCCATNFFSGQPALNYGFANPEKSWQQGVDEPGPRATKLAMMDVMDFWLDMGCDGFRVDMAGSMIKGDKDGQATVEFWKEVRAFLDEKHPEAAIISEWGRPELSLAGGFHMDFLLAFGPARYQELFRGETPYFCREGKGDIGFFARKYEEYMEQTGGKGLICIPSGNHDTPRIGGRLDAEEIKLVFAFLASMPGAPFIYYGDEIGMKYIKGMKSKEGGYERTGSRTPMQWDAKCNAGFSAAPREKLYLPIDPDPNRPNVAAQQGKEGSLWEEVKKLLHIRQEHPALQSEAGMRFVYAEDHAYPLVYERSCEEETVLVILNPSGRRETCRLSGLSWGEVIYEKNGGASYEDGVLTAEPESAVYLKIK